MLPADIPWHWLTRFGEAQILLPLVLGAALWLWLGAGQGRLALRWLACISAAALLTTATKLMFFGWGWGVSAWDFTGISGHAMFAAASLPMLAWVALMDRRRPVQRGGVALAFAWAAVIAYSRLPVGAHSASEVLTGFLLGASASVLSLRGLPGPRPAAPLWLPAALVVALLVLPFSAPRSRTHDWVTGLSVKLSGRLQPFNRHDLHGPASSMKGPAGQRMGL